MYKKLPAGLVAGAAAVAASLAVAGSGVAQRQASAATVVRVKAKDLLFVLSRKTVPHGKIQFVITNPSPAVHDFAIAGHKSKRVKPHKSTTLTVTLKRGRYPYKCTVDSHAKLGMKGVLRVT